MTTAIRDPLVNRHVSIVALYPKCRLMVQKQGKSASAAVWSWTAYIGACDAGCRIQIFLTASLEERPNGDKRITGRRKEISYEQVLEEIAARDKIDSERNIHRFGRLKDAILIDTTELSA